MKGYLRYEISSCEPLLHYSGRVSTNGNCFFLVWEQPFVRNAVPGHNGPTHRAWLRENLRSPGRKLTVAMIPATVCWQKLLNLEKGTWDMGAREGLLLWAEIFSEAFSSAWKESSSGPFSLCLISQFHPIASGFCFVPVWFSDVVCLKCLLSSGIVVSSIYNHLVKTLLRNWRWRGGGRGCQGRWLVSLALQPRLFHHAAVSFTDGLAPRDLDTRLNDGKSEPFS